MIHLLNFVKLAWCAYSSKLFRSRVIIQVYSSGLCIINGSVPPKVRNCVNALCHQTFVQ